MDRKSDKVHVSHERPDAAECFTLHLRAHTCTQHTTRTMAGLLNMAGLSLTRAFAGAQLRAKAASEAFSMHYTPSLLTRVRKMYAMDYALLRKVDAME